MIIVVANINFAVAYPVYMPPAAIPVYDTTLLDGTGENKNVATLQLDNGVNWETWDTTRIGGWIILEFIFEDPIELDYVHIQAYLEDTALTTYDYRFIYDDYEDDWDDIGEGIRYLYADEGEEVLTLEIKQMTWGCFEINVDFCWGIIPT